MNFVVLKLTIYLILTSFISVFCGCSHMVSGVQW